jgi:choline kinase
MKAILLAAGRGSRLKADALPKPLWEIGPSSLEDPTPISLLERQILCLKRSGVKDIGVIVGWHKELVIERVAPLGVQIIENTHPDISASGTSHSFQFAACSAWNPLDGKSPVMPMDGDLAYEQSVMDAIVSAPAKTALLICPGINEDSEEVRVYGDPTGSPRLIGKGLGVPLTEGLKLLGEATGIVRYEPEDHTLVRSLLTWLVGTPHQSRGYGFAKIASEHEELSQYLCNLKRVGTHVLPKELCFMEVDFQEEFDLLRAQVYPRILERDRLRGV